MSPIDYADQAFLLPKSRPRVLDRQDKAKADASEQKRVAKLVRARDMGRCRIAGCKKGPLETHHLIKRSASKALRHARENLVTLCKQDHQLAEANVLKFTGSPDDNSLSVTDRRSGTTVPARPIQ